MSGLSPAYRIINTIKNKNSKGLSLEAEAISGGLKKGMTVRLQPEGTDIRIKDAEHVTGTKYILKTKGAALKSFTGNDWLFPPQANSFSSSRVPLLLLKDLPEGEFNDGWILTVRGERTRISIEKRINSRLLLINISRVTALLPGETAQISRGREIALRGRICFRLHPGNRKAEESLKQLEALSSERESLKKEILEILLNQDGIIFNPRDVPLDSAVETGKVVTTQSFLDTFMNIIKPHITQQGGIQQNILQEKTRIPKFLFQALIEGLIENRIIYKEGGYLLFAGELKGSGLSPMAAQILNDIEKQGISGLKISTLRSSEKSSAISDLVRMRRVKSNGSWVLSNAAFDELSQKIKTEGSPPYSPGKLAEKWDIPRGLIFSVLNLMDG